MRKFWWVNHNQTAPAAIAGGYLWSPKREVHGARSQFYLNMRKATPGDAVASYANGVIAHIGRVTDFAFSSPRPMEFSSAEAYWRNDGWLLPVEWQPLGLTFNPAEHLNEIASLLPRKYSPLNARTGYGNQKAYLAQIDAALFEIVLQENKILFRENDGRLRSQTKELSERIDNQLVQQIRTDRSISKTEREQLIKSRIGQGRFRKDLFDIDGRCRVTHIDNPELLIASHIKPWRSCRDHRERLDPFNGLLLAPHIDHLFDLGFLTFSDDGRTILSEKLEKKDFERLGVAVAYDKVQPFRNEHRKYLSYHRSDVFLKEDDDRNPW